MSSTRNHLCPSLYTNFRFKIAVAKVRERGSDSIDDETLDTVVRGCDTLLLGKLTDIPTYKRFDWAISRAAESETGRRHGRMNAQDCVDMRLSVVCRLPYHTGGKVTHRIYHTGDKITHRIYHTGDRITHRTTRVIR